MNTPMVVAIGRAKCRIHTTLLLVVACAFCTACHKATAGNLVVEAADTPKDNQPCPCAAEDSYFGINGTKLFHVGDASNDIVVKRLQWMDELNVHWDRNDLWWHMVEPRPGEWDFSRPDHVFDALEQHDIHFYPILCYGAAWFTGDRTAPNPDEIDDYVEYVEKTVRRYHGRARYWEVWNEPNIHEFWRPNPDAAAYTRLLKAAYPAIKRADPQALVCAPGIAPLGPWDRKFVETMYQHGAADFFDVFDYHYYRNHPPEEEVPAEIAEIKAVIRHYDREKPIQISESGVSSIWEGKSGQDDRQASLVVRNQLLCFALGIDRFYYFDLQNWRDNDPSDWASQLGLVTAAGKPKQAFYAYKTLIREVDCRTFIGRHQRLGPDTEGVLIYDQHRDSYMLAIWLTSEDASRYVTLEVAGDTAYAVDPDGKRQELNVRKLGTEPGGKVRVQVDKHPRYFHGVDPLEYLPEAGVRFEHALTILAAGEEIALPLHVDSRLENPQVEVARVEADRGLSWDTRTERLRCAAWTSPGIAEVRAFLDVAHGPADDRRSVRLRRTAKVEVVQPATVDTRMYLRDDELRCRVSLVNHAQRSLEHQLRLEMVDGGNAIVTLPKIKLDVRGVHHADFAVPDDQTSSPSGVAKMHVTYGPNTGREIRRYSAQLRPHAPRIDGRLDDWIGTAELSIDSADHVFVGRSTWTAADASATCRVAFSNDTLYVAAEIRDDDPQHNDSPHYALWQGDSIELFLGKCGPTRRSVIVNECDVHLAIAPKHKGGTAIVFRHRPDRTISEAKVATHKTDEGYTLEAAIPLESLDIDKPPAPGQLFAFDITLNDGDADDDNPVHRIVWNGTARNWIDPSDYGLLLVQKE